MIVIKIVSTWLFGAKLNLYSLVCPNCPKTCNCDGDKPNLFHEIDKVKLDLYQIVCNYTGCVNRYGLDLVKS